MCTARPLCRTTHPCQKASVPASSMHPTSLSTAPPRLWAQGCHPRSPAAIFAARWLMGLSRHGRTWGRLRHTQHPATHFPALGAERELCRVEKKQHPSSLQSKGCLQSPLPHPSAKKSPCPSRAPCLWVRLPVQNSVGTKPGGSSPPSPAGTPARRDGHFPGRRRTGARTKAHPGRDTPMGPAATPAPAQKSTRCQCNPPGFC